MLRQDLRQALRHLRRRPAFSAVAVGTLALGIGAATAMFSVVYGVLLRPLPYPGADRLVAIWETYPHWRGDPALEPYWDAIRIAWPDFERLTAGQRSFEEIAAWRWSPKTLSTPAGAEQVNVALATPSLFPLLGVTPQRGRLLLPEEVGPGAPRVALVTDTFWRGHLGGDLDAVGATLRIDDRPYTIVGILSAAFHPPPTAPDGSPSAVWIPVGADGGSLAPSNHSFRVLGRLRAGVTPDVAAAETLPLLRGGLPPAELGIRLDDYRNELVATARAPLLLLLGAVGLLLLLACGNVALLLLSDAAGRKREMATRSALGAGRRRLLTQLLMEGMLLSGLAVVLGGLVAFAGSRALISIAPPELPLGELVTVDARVLALAALTGVVTAAAFTLAAAAVLLRDPLRPQYFRAPATRGGAAGIQGAVAAAEVAFCAILLVGSSLLGRSLLQLTRVDPGFDGTRVLIVDVLLPEDRYGEGRAAADWHHDAKERLEALSGVRVASSGSAVPFTGGNVYGAVDIEGRSGDADELQARYSVITPGYFEALSVPVLAGRAFAETEGGSGTDVAMVSRSMADRFWPGEPPLGQRLVHQGMTRTVIGVVGDVRHLHLSEAVEPEFYVPLGSEGFGGGRFATLLIRTERDPASLARATRAALRELDPEVSVTRVATLPDLVSRSSAAEKYRTLLLGVFAVLAAVLAAVGIAGVNARVVAERNREIGIRVALGAPAAEVLRLVGARSLAGALVGAAVGLSVAALARNAVAGFLYGIGSDDVTSYALAAGVLAALTLLATVVPVRRSLAVDPVVCLRDE